ncbi:MAG: 4Fe-4S binding protein [Dehalococcoidales bacterium]
MAKPEGELAWKDLEIGSIVIEPGSASQYQTGSWRTERPIIDLDKCNKCGLCYIFCPDVAIGLNGEGYPETDLFYCKGCGICAVECPKKAITMVEEGE